MNVWCDVHTDGGGFMLVGVKDSPVSWTVPSNSAPVHPQGPAHWSSVLGDIEILDFGVQFSSNDSFQGTKQHWLYRLKQKRQLGDLFIKDQPKSCNGKNPGIGDVMFVKDVRTGSVATNNFRCSEFGPHTHHSLGWARMNNCLRNVCKKGYAIIPGTSFQYTSYGSFSYSAVSDSSGTDRNSTAFVGCDDGKCCACFGPKGGRQHYCGPKCTAINGGTVLKKAFVWFWVRSRIPQRLWKRCMEFKIRNSAGNLEPHFVDPRTGTAHKTLTVSDKESFEKIPEVPGLLSYRKDTKELYVSEGSKWQALSSEEEVQELQQNVKSEQSAIRNLENKIQTQQNQLQAQQSFAQNLKSMIKNLQNNLKTQEKQLQAQQSLDQKQGSKISHLRQKYQDISDEVKRLHPITSCSMGQRRNTSLILSNGTYTIYPKDLKTPVQVYCDMTSENGIGVTVIGHDSESRTHVIEYENPGSYKRRVNYNISMEQIVAIIKQSKHCAQFIKYECYHSVFWHGLTPIHYGWWVSRQGSKMNYWGGAAVNSGTCACGMTNTCAGGGNCNCDANDEAWRSDSGYLTDKKTLPVSELRFGDISGYDFDATKFPSDIGYRFNKNGRYEQGFYTLGKLRCWG